MRDRTASLLTMMVSLLCLALLWNIHSRDTLIEQLEAQIDDLSHYHGESEVLVGAQPRSSQWPSVRAKYLRSHPTCEACNAKDDLNVHHIKPYHLYPELELVTSNLITLCRTHHFLVGHDPDGSGPKKPNWSEANLNARADAKRLLEYNTQRKP